MLIITIYVVICFVSYSESFHCHAKTMLINSIPDVIPVFLLEWNTPIPVHSGVPFRSYIFFQIIHKFLYNNDNSGSFVCITITEGLRVPSIEAQHVALNQAHEAGNQSPRTPGS
jgi:hypothetical protein